MKIIIIIEIILSLVSYQKKELKKDYYKNGSLKAEYFVDENGKKYGVAKLYFPNGKLEFIGTFHNNKLEGKTIEYWDSGVEKEVANYIKGMLNGLFFRYFSSGKTKTIINYKNNKISGTAIEFFESGTISKVENYSGGVLNGKSFYYYKSGRLKIVVKYVKGEKQGDYSVYNYNGTLSEEGHYKRNKLDGNIELYDNSGHLEKTIFFKNGIQDSVLRGRVLAPNSVASPHLQKSSRPANAGARLGHVASQIFQTG